jgi:hypothetical protein
MGLFFLSLAVFALVMLAMTVGVIFKYLCLRGACGGSEVGGPNSRALFLCYLSERSRGRAE